MNRWRLSVTGIRTRHLTDPVRLYAVDSSDASTPPTSACEIKPDRYASERETRSQKTGSFCSPNPTVTSPPLISTERIQTIYRTRETACMMTENAGSSHRDLSSAEAKWWESAEDHRFALEVLQLPLRRHMLRFIGMEARSRDEIEREFGLSTEQANYHLAMLEKGLVVERAGNSYRPTIAGKLYLEKADAREFLKNSNTARLRS